MPTTDGLVGGTQIPVPAGEEKEKLTDPLVEALLSLSAFYIKDSLDAKLQNLTGTSSDACPNDSKHRHTFDPLEPRGVEVKLLLPSLFVFWNTVSTWQEQTQFYAIRTRFIEMMYVFNELPSYSEMERRSGLFNAVDTAMFKMGVHQVRRDFAIDSSPLGTWINTSLTPGSPNFVSWEWMGGYPGRFGIDEGPRAERRFAKKSGRDFPALKGRWKAEERVALQTLLDPEDLTMDIPFDIYANDGEGCETVLVREGLLTKPDGTGEL